MRQGLAGTGAGARRPAAATEAGRGWMRCGEALGQLLLRCGCRVALTVSCTGLAGSARGSALVRRASSGCPRDPLARLQASDQEQPSPTHQSGK